MADAKEYVSKIELVGKTLYVRDEEARNDIETTSTELKQEMGELNTQLTEDMTELKNNVDDEITRYARNRLTGVKVLMIGDSFLRGSGGVVGRGWGYYFQENTGCEALIHQDAGGGFIAKGGSTSDYPNKTFVDVLEDVVADMAESERSEVKHVVVGGGWNDGISGTYDENALYAAISQFCQIARTNFPYAKIYIIPLKAEGVLSTQERARAYDNWVNEAMAQGVVTCIESLDWFTGRNNYAAGDGVHLNDSGYGLCGRYMAGVVYGNRNSYQPNTNGTVQLMNGVTIPEAQRFRVKRFQNLVVMQGALRVPAAAFAAGTQLVAVDRIFMPWGNTEVMCHTSNGTWVPVGFGSDAGVYISTYADGDLLPKVECTVYITATFWVGN